MLNNSALHPSWGNGIEQSWLTYFFIRSKYFEFSTLFITYKLYRYMQQIFGAKRNKFYPFLVSPVSPPLSPKVGCSSLKCGQTQQQIKKILAAARQKSFWNLTREKYWILLDIWIKDIKQVVMYEVVKNMMRDVNKVVGTTEYIVLFICYGQYPLDMHCTRSLPLTIHKWKDDDWLFEGASISSWDDSCSPLLSSNAVSKVSKVSDIRPDGRGEDHFCHWNHFHKVFANIKSILFFLFVGCYLHYNLYIYIRNKSLHV